MKKELIRKIVFYGVYETRRYRYRDCDDGIYRIDKRLLGTTAALNGWEKVHVGNR